MADISHPAISPGILIVSIVPQGKGAGVIKCAKQYHARGGFTLFGDGTASEEIWQRLGITQHREIVFSVTLHHKVDVVMNAIAEKIKASSSKTGIIFALSIDRFLGQGMLKHLIEKIKKKELEHYLPDFTPEIEKEIHRKVMCMMERIEEEKQEACAQCAFELLIVRMARGYAQEVMDCARKAGARGGTIVHGRVSLDDAEVKFFNITIEPEGDVLFLLVAKEKAADIMDAISEKHGPLTPAHAFGFIVPVLKTFPEIQNQ